MNHPPNLDDDAFLSVVDLNEDAVAAHLAAIGNRLSELLPARCIREIDDYGMARAVDPKRTRQQLVICEAAVGALGQSSRALCDQQDSLNGLHSYFVREARRHEESSCVSNGMTEVARRLAGIGTRKANFELCSLLSSLTLARMRGLRSVLLAQLDREFDLRNGRPSSPDVQLPVASGSGGGDQELELVPVDPDDGSEVAGGGGGGAAPAVVVAAIPSDSTDTGAAVDDDDDDGLGFLELDRRS